MRDTDGGSALRRLVARGLTALLPLTMGVLLLAPTAAHAASYYYDGPCYDRYGEYLGNGCYVDDGYNNAGYNNSYLNDCYDRYGYYVGGNGCYDDGYNTNRCYDNRYRAPGFLGTSYIPSTAAAPGAPSLDINRLARDYLCSRAVGDQRYDDGGGGGGGYGGGDTVIFDDSPVNIDF